MMSFVCRMSSCTEVVDVSRWVRSCRRMMDEKAMAVLPESLSSSSFTVTVLAMSTAVLFSRRGSLFARQLVPA